MKNYILISLLLPSCLLSKVSRKELKYALEHPGQSYLTIDKKHVRFIDEQIGTIRSVKLSSIKRKQKKLYNKIKVLRRKQKKSSKKIHALAKQMTIQRLQREEQLFQQRKTGTSYCSTRPRPRKRISFSPVPPKVHTFDKHQPVDSTVRVDEWKIVDDWGREAPSGVRIYSTCRMSMDLD